MEHFSNTYQEDFLEDLIPHFNARGMDLTLERMTKAIKAMGNPCSEIPAIQVVGTNGKGSIASFIKSTLKVKGIKAGVTTSPHLISWCERIVINDQAITPEQLKLNLKILHSISEKYQLTLFEKLIAVAFEHFAKQKVELMVLEVGLGGRLDATTAHPWRPIIAMASIGLDHCEHLGQSLSAIAKEKAAAITHKSTVISAPQNPVVTKILELTSIEKNANLKWVHPLPKEWELGIPGEIQRENAAVAKGALEALAPLGWRIRKSDLLQGFALAKWPARLQKANWKEEFPLIIDCAHNPPAAKQLSKERQFWDNQENGITWILGIQIHKEGPKILRHLIKSKDSAWIVPVPDHNSWSKRQLSEACPELTNQLHQVDEVEQVLHKIFSKNHWPTPPPVITGSLYLAAHLLKNRIISTN